MQGWRWDRADSQCVSYGSFLKNGQAKSFLVETQEGFAGVDDERIDGHHDSVSGAASTYPISVNDEGPRLWGITTTARQNTESWNTSYSKMEKASPEWELHQLCLSVGNLHGVRWSELKGRSDRGSDHGED
jgi:hypothetical protein